MEFIKSKSEVAGRQHIQNLEREDWRIVPGKGLLGSGFAFLFLIGGNPRTLVDTK